MPSKTDTSQPLIKRLKFSSKVGSSLILTLFAIAVLLAGILAAIFGHKFGFQQGYKASQHEIAARGEAQELSSDEIETLNTQLKAMQKQLQTANNERDISLSNLDKLREEIEALKLTNLQLNQVNNVFAKSLAKRGGLALDVVGANIEPLPENAFEYRFDVAMLAGDNSEHRLTPQLILLDEDNLVEVPLEPSTYDIKGIARIRGRFVMPKGFQPKQAKLILTANGQETEQIYDWTLDKPVDEMPLSLDDVPETDQRPVTDSLNAE